MRIERSSDLIYWTYFMIDWGKTEQYLSEQKCMQCGGPMKRVEPVTDKKGVSFDGLVCHSCRRVIWARTGR